MTAWEKQKQKMGDVLFHFAWIALIGSFLWAFTVGMAPPPTPTYMPGCLGWAGEVPGVNCYLPSGGGGGAAFRIDPRASCGEVCWLIIGWAAERAWNYVSGVAKNNSCNPCGGGGGGGFGTTGCEVDSTDICHIDTN